MNDTPTTVQQVTRAIRRQIAAEDPQLLRCPSCDYVIHEDNEGRCPECALEINWSDICIATIEIHRDRFKHLHTEVAKLPIETLCCPKCAYRVHGLTRNRCPECGESFDLDSVFNAAISKRANLFEHQWYVDPLNSLAKTVWLGALMPFRLWGSYNKSDTPRAGPLLALILIQWLFFARGWHLVALGVDPLMNLLGSWLPGRGMRFTYTARISNADLTDFAVWSSATFFTLLMFVQSNQQYRASWRHVLRVFAHATIFASLCTAIGCIMEAGLDSTLFIQSWSTKPGTMLNIIPGIYYTHLGNGVMYVALASVWAGLWIGYSRYLRIPHGWAISAVAILVGHVAAQSLRVFALDS